MAAKLVTGVRPVAVLLVVVMVWRGVSGGGVCPPGGQYFDKHLGQNGRYRCCSEICQYSHIKVYKDDCDKKCPNYNSLAGKSTTTSPTPESHAAQTRGQLPQQQQQAQQQGTSSQTNLVTILSASLSSGVAVMSVVVLLLVLAFRKHRRHGKGTGTPPREGPPEMIPLQNNVNQNGPLREAAEQPLVGGDGEGPHASGGFQEGGAAQFANYHTAQVESARFPIRETGSDDVGARAPLN